MIFDLQNPFFILKNVIFSYLIQILKKYIEKYTHFLKYFWFNIPSSKVTP